MAKPQRPPGLHAGRTARTPEPQTATRAASGALPTATDVGSHLALGRLVLQASASGNCNQADR
jgi:hypothetical protein